MMRIDPSLLVGRLVVFCRGVAVYDQRFHAGVNIIRGENSVGKSTILDFIFYVLGGEGVLWKEEAAECDVVFCEAELNGVILTLRRSLRGGKERPIGIFWGTSESALSNAETGWSQYPYARTEKVSSFSQVLFEAMGIPQVKGELTASLTMHQVLRLLYADQLTATGKLFRHDEWDRKLGREAVGDLLCGYLDELLYDAEIRHREASELLVEKRGQLKQLSSVLGGEERLPSFYAQTIKSLKLELSALYLSAEMARVEQRITPAQSAEQRKQIASVEKELLATTKEQSEMKSSIQALQFAVADSAEFIESVEGQIKALEDSLVARTALGVVPFSSCPSCGHPLQPSDGTACNLCKHPYDGGPRDAALLRMQQEMRLQLRESMQLQESRGVEIGKASNRLRELETARFQLEARLRDMTSNVVDVALGAIQEIYRKIGATERELDDLHKQEKLAMRLEELRTDRDRLVVELQKLSDEIRARQDASQRRRSEAKGLVSRIAARFLRADLFREQTFRDAEFVDFDFGEDQVSVGGRRAFSASSMVILTNAVHLGLLFASIETEFFRLPRFMLFDNIEDKGMEMARSQNFQLAIVAASRAASVRHQIIFSTSMIAAQLNVEEFVVGDFYSNTNKTLRMPKQ